MSFAEEKQHQADERVAAAEARARQAEEQLMSIAASLRYTHTTAVMLCSDACPLSIIPGGVMSGQ